MTFLLSIGIAFVSWIVWHLLTAPDDPYDTWHKEAVIFREKSDDKVQD